ncbi:MAG: ABC transporter permease [Bacillota bacterium]|nr:ABC transporter permease [Bacillota bacterium]
MTQKRNKKQGDSIWGKLSIPILSVLFGFLIGAIIMLLSGYNPIEAYLKMVEGAGLFGNLRRLGFMLTITTPLVLTGLAVAFGMRTGLFNIGASGQLLMGGFAAVLLGIVLDLPKVPHLLIAVSAAVVAGAIWGMIPGLLKSLFNVHEVVSSIMLNWIAVWTVYYFVPLLIKGKYDTESMPIRETASLRVDWLTDLLPGSPINLGLFFALGAAVLIWWILEKTTFGYELKAVGFNRDAAQYAGMHVKRNIVLSMAISGALAGLAGATFYLGYSDNIKIGELPSLGFDGIAVALLGMNSPLGVIFSALLFGVMNAGKNFMQSSTGVPNELAQIIMAIIIFFAAAKLVIVKVLEHFKKNKRKEKSDVGTNR